MMALSHPALCQQGPPARRPNAALAELEERRRQKLAQLRQQHMQHKADLLRQLQQEVLNTTAAAEATGALTASSGRRSQLQQQQQGAGSSPGPVDGGETPQQLVELPISGEQFQDAVVGASAGDAPAGAQPAADGGTVVQKPTTVPRLGGGSKQAAAAAAATSAGKAKRLPTAKRPAAVAVAPGSKPPASKRPTAADIASITKLSVPSFVKKVGEYDRPWRAAMKKGALSGSSSPGVKGKSATAWAVQQLSKPAAGSPAAAKARTPEQLAELQVSGAEVLPPCCKICTATCRWDQLGRQGMLLLLQLWKWEMHYALQPAKHHRHASAEDPTQPCSLPPLVCVLPQAFMERRRSQMAAEQAEQRAQQQAQGQRLQVVKGMAKQQRLVSVSCRWAHPAAHTAAAPCMYVSCSRHICLGTCTRRPIVFPASVPRLMPWPLAAVVVLQAARKAASRRASADEGTSGWCPTQRWVGVLSAEASGASSQREEQHAAASLAQGMPSLAAEESWVGEQEPGCSSRSPRRGLSPSKAAADPKRVSKAARSAVVACATSGVPAPLTSLMPSQCKL
jgi:hypothetical protein